MADFKIIYATNQNKKTQRRDLKISLGSQQLVFEKKRRIKK